MGTFTQYTFNRVVMSTYSALGTHSSITEGINEILEHAHGLSEGDKGDPEKLKGILKRLHGDMK